MIRFQIPRPFLPGFESLISLDNKQIKEIVQFLTSVPVGTGPQTFGSLFIDKFKGRPPFTNNLASTLYSLGSFILNTEKVSRGELVSSLAQSYNEQTGRKLNEDKVKKLELTLQEAVDASNSLVATFKAFQLLSENESVVRDAHIVTDIRLLFKEEMENQQRHGLVKHQLKLQVEEDGEQTDYYFSITITDLQKMQDQITRALQKEGLIRSDYENSISFISITE